MGYATSWGVTRCPAGSQTAVVREILNGGTQLLGWLDLRWNGNCAGGLNWARVRSSVGVQDVSATVTRPRDGRSYTYAGRYATVYTLGVVAPH